MNPSIRGSVVWDEVEKGPAICLANVAPEGAPYQSCGRKLRLERVEDSDEMECPKHGIMH